MESNIDIKELWNRQAVPAADQSEILNKISRFRKSGLKSGIFLDVILVLTILFMIFIWIYFKPQFLSTKIGIIVGILPMCIVVEQVMKYIEENYAEEELSLNLLASHVNFSPNHLSMIFSQQTGMSFIKYLTDYRMNKAKELLRCTGKRSSLISQEVGYKDPHYFSYLFKKTQGMTPTQYRGGIK